MANEELLNNNEEAMEEVDVYTLVDEEGNEGQFQIIGEHEMNGVVYYALIPVDEESDEYVILKLTKDEDGEDILITIEDDDEFDRVADFFEDELFDEVDYDSNNAE